MKIRHIFISAITILMVSSSCSHRLTIPNGWYEKGINKYFRNEYVKQDYEKYNGKITITEKSGQTFIDFDSLKVNVALTIEDDKYKNIFMTNLFSPQMFGVINNDSISISNVVELTYVRTKPTQRRFVYWIFYRNWMNPSEYYLELTNKTANKQTDIVTFLKEAKVTHLSEARMIL